jgi:hypothetical protein
MVDRKGACTFRNIERQFIPDLTGVCNILFGVSCTIYPVK